VKLHKLRQQAIVLACRNQRVQLHNVIVIKLHMHPGMNLPFFFFNLKVFIKE